ncbi:MAG: glycoside hydrolase family 2, partial [Proteobacteria bacterium]
MKDESNTAWENWDSNQDDYPRKTLRRPNWLSLNGPWKFAFDDERVWNRPEKVPHYPHIIQVPFCPESEMSGVHDQNFHPRCWYHRSFKLAKSKNRFILHFGAVDYEASVWVNQTFLGRHTGGHSSFSYDITEALLESGENTITVRADDDPVDLSKPRGKQDWQLHPHSIWYMRTSGIWQTVWIEEVPQTYLQKIVWTPHLERWEIGCEAFLAGTWAGNFQLRVKLSAGEKVLVDDRYTFINREITRRIALSDPGIDDFRNELLWSPEKPTLIEAELEVWDGDVLVERVRSYTALRSVAVKRGRFLLNGRPYYMRLILDQGYWPKSLMTAPDPLAFKKDIELTKSAGFNGVRKHQKIEDPNYLYWADKLGLLVWVEMPSAYRFTHESVQRLTKEWAEIIDRDLNHPSVAVWVAFNESWGVPDLAEAGAHQNYVQAVYHLTRTLDPTRPVIGNDGWESTATDIIGIHDYDDNTDRIKGKYGTTVSKINDVLAQHRPAGRMLTVEGYPHEGQPLMLTEFGGIACKAEGTKDGTWGYSTSKSGEDLKFRFVSLLKTINQIEIFCGFCYTQFT